MIENLTKELHKKLLKYKYSNAENIEIFSGETNKEYYFINYNEDLINIDIHHNIDSMSNLYCNVFFSLKDNIFSIYNYTNYDLLSAIKEVSKILDNKMLPAIK